MAVSDWQKVVEDGTFETLDNFRLNYPNFFQENNSLEVAQARRGIVLKAFDSAKDYETINKLVKHYRRDLYPNNIQMRINLNDKLWDAFVRSHGRQKMQQFLEDHPSHVLNYDCYARECAEAFSKNNLQSLIQFIEAYPRSYLAYDQVSWHIYRNYRNDAKEKALLSKQELSRFEEVIETCRQHTKFYQSVNASMDEEDLLNLIQRGAPSWRSFLLFRSVLSNLLRKKEWEAASALIGVVKGWFPSMKPARCRPYYYTLDSYFEDLEKIIEAEDKPIDPKPIKELNTRADEILPFVSPDGKTLFFTGNGRPDGLKGDDPYQVSIQDSTFGKPELIPGLAGSKNESLLSVTADGQEALVYVDRQLHISQKKEDGWTKPQPLSSIQQQFYTVGKASLSADGNTLVFEAVSNKPSPGASPNFDIFIAFRNAEGQWRKPFPLPRNINTRFQERSPYLHLDGESLYFSSNGHLGLGGMDVYKITRLDDTWTLWSEPENMGKEINTVEDDWGFNFSVVAAGDTAFFSRDDYQNGRKGELMMIGLPERVRPKATVLLQLPVKDLNSSFLEVKDRNGVVFKAIKIKPGSQFVTMAVPEEKGQIQIEPKVAKADTLITNVIEIDLTVPLDSQMIDTLQDYTIKELVDSEIAFQIPNVRFERSQSELRPKAMLALKRFYESIKKAEVKFTIVGHTDDVGKKEANQFLSEQRAEKVKSFIVSLGYPPGRIETIGKGWAEPKVPNTSEASRAVNRRVEFILSE
ncbi:MAG: OmpA family protein [Saprospiraceae bacterium]|nr:OmpA family protein [Saprospiraceae bacterium]